MEERMRNLRLWTESKVSDDSGNAVTVWRVEARAPEDRAPVSTLVKCGRRVHAVHELGTIRVSKPPHFRKYGEGLVRDPSEGTASTSVTTEHRVDDPRDLRERQEFFDEIGACAESIGEKIRLTAISSKTTSKRTSRILFGRNGWIYSTAIEPTSEEQWDQLWKSLEPEYDHADHIYRISQFAWSLGLMVVEQLGARGQDQIHTDSFGDQSFETRSKGQLIVHGPVIYVADPFRAIDSARTDMERTLLPIFVKHRRFVGHREYRFVIWTEEEPPELLVDLKVSHAMLGALDKKRSGPARTPRAPRASDGKSSSTEPPEEAIDVDGESPSGNLLASTSDWFWPDLLAATDNPATPLSRTIDPVAYADNPRAATTASALSALRSKVAQVRGERRWKAASSAWHAEPWISHICKRFKDPIGGISITDDDILVVSLKFPKGVETKAKLSFGPGGAYVYVVKGAGEQLLSHSLHPDGPAIPSRLEETLSRLGLVAWPEPDAAKLKGEAGRDTDRELLRLRS